MAVNQRRYYRSFSLSKGSKTRHIDAPKVALKLIQTWFGFHLARTLKLGSEVHGFVPGKSAFTAAREHCQSNWVLGLDIKDFFPSIDEAQIVQVLKGIGYSPGASRLLARLFTLDGKLPQGAPSSPVLANLAFAKTDKKLVALANENNVRYTRYADDLTFSSQNPLQHTKFRNEILATIRDHNWTISTKKTKLTLAPRRLEVLGLVVNGPRPRLSKKMRNKLRLMQYLLAMGNKSHEDKLRYGGYLSYARSVGEKF
jgi:retron-type reverse transcriptase